MQPFNKEQPSTHDTHSLAQDSILEESDCCGVASSITCPSPMETMHGPSNQSNGGNGKAL